MKNDYYSFATCSQRVEDYQCDDVFYVYPDNTQKGFPLPESLEEAYDSGFLTISLYDDKFSTWYLNIGNEEYTGSLHEMQQLLYDWAKSEGYQF
jgi:hypothetical protein